MPRNLIPVPFEGSNAKGKRTRFSVTGTHPAINYANLSLIFKLPCIFPSEERISEASESGFDKREFKRDERFTRQRISFFSFFPFRRASPDVTSRRRFSIGRTRSCRRICCRKLIRTPGHFRPSEPQLCDGASALPEKSRRREGKDNGRDDERRGLGRRRRGRAETHSK